MIKKFLDFTEIKTKITSLFAFLMTIAYLFYEKKAVNWRLTLIFFLSMFVFDLATTAINNYIDTRSNGQALPFERGTALRVIYALLAVSIASGIYLAYLTDIVILAVGALCFFCGILYTFGPVPISRQPLGEILSGVFYGLFIPFILLYINLPRGTILSLQLSFEAVNLQVNVAPALTVALLAVVPTCVTANIMLANNICDVERDIAARRFTLPYYLGNKALMLFAGIYYIAYLDIAVMAALRILSPLCLVALLTIFPVQKNISRFFKLQDKAVTFIVSIQNYILIMGSVTLMIWIGGLVG